METQTNPEGVCMEGAGDTHGHHMLNRYKGRLDSHTIIEALPRGCYMYIQGYKRLAATFSAHISTVHQGRLRNLQHITLTTNSLKELYFLNTYRQRISSSLLETKLYRVK